MKYYFFELNPIFKENKIYKNPDRQPEIIAILDTGDSNFYDYMEENWYHSLCWNDEFTKNMELDKYYYVIPEVGYNCWVFSAHKGFAFWDTAEYDDRVVIAVEFGIDSDKMRI